MQQVAHAVLEARHDNEPVASYQVLVRNLIFYTHVRQSDLANADQLLGYLNSPTRVLAVVPASTLETLERDHPGRVRRLAEFPYFDGGGVRLRMLIDPDDPENVQRVVVVANE